MNRIDRRMTKVFSCLMVSGCLLGAASAQIYADFQTSLGNFSCELSYEETPRTVANFIGLAEGSRVWVDERNGQVSTTRPARPFYDGLSFHRVVNDAPAFAIAQAGSRTADGMDGPGYTFPDEIDPAVPETSAFDQPYLLAMANSGPNTNGSQFFLTGTTIPHLEGLHTIFGRVVAGTDVVDEILEVEVDANDKPVTPVVIQSVLIRRVGKEAAKFKATKQPLPKLAAAKFKAVPLTNGNHRLLYKQPGASATMIWTDTPANPGWELVFERYIGPGGAVIPGADVSLGGRVAPLPKPTAWLRPVLVRYPAEALAPTQVAGRRLTLSNEAGDFVFDFAPTGNGTYAYTEEGTTTPQTGTITGLSYSPDGYGATLVVESSGLFPLRFRLGFDGQSGASLDGRQSGSFWSIFRWVPLADGSSFTLAPLP
jgi:cyclophilin family peptidyl-prolyl cis-trans isomerase